MWNLVFLFSGFIFIILLYIIFISKTRVNSLENKIFRILIFTNLLGYISEIILQFGIRFLPEDSLFTIILSKVYVLYIAAWFGIFSIYTCLVTQKSDEELHFERTEDYKLIKYIHIIIMIILGIILLLLPISIFNDGSMMYSYGLSTNVLKMSLVVCVLF